MRPRYEYEVLQRGEWQTGGCASTPESAISEADHFAMMYGQDGPVEVKFYVQLEVSRAELLRQAQEK